MRKDDTARYDSLFFVQEDWETSYQIQFDKDYTSSFLASLPQGRQLTIFSAGWKPSQQMVLGCVCQPQRICLACLHVTLFLSKQQAINAECFPVLSNRGWGGRRNPWEEIQKWFSFIYDPLKVVSLLDRVQRQNRGTDRILETHGNWRSQLPTR